MGAPPLNWYWVTFAVTLISKSPFRTKMLPKSLSLSVFASSCVVLIISITFLLDFLIFS
jgi:hypothetical protein